jgi:hypothetical protein
VVDFVNLEHSSDNIELKVAVSEAEKMREEHYHLIAPTGFLTGTIVKLEEHWEFHSVKESESDKIHVKVPEEAVSEFLEEVEITENGGENPQ